ncbi:MAG: amidohydrolase family protein [Alphaproteobacteria bacterium]|nr:amidohydrolase family protein [Alphaproteobacteria bacterium]
MPYAAGRIFHDADSHIMESGDWLASYADPGIRDRLKRMRFEAGGALAEKAIAAAQKRQGDAAATAAISANVIAGPKGWAAYGAMNSDERVRALNDLGFASQLVFTTFAGSQFSGADENDVRYGGARALNRGITEFCKADKRLIPVGVVPLSDPERALIETKEALRLGCGAIWVAASPAGDRSPGHPDLDPIWRLLAETSTPFMLHVGAASRVHPEAYFNNGRPRTTDWLGGGENLRGKDFMTLSFAPQMFLAAMAFDGVFQRFPSLRGGVIELGAGWVADFLRRLDHGWRSFKKTDPALGELAEPPSHFVRRAVRFTPFANEDVGAIIREGGPDLFLFSSDYPHPEGTKNPIERFEANLATFPEDVKDQFYRRNFEYMMAKA